MKNVVNHPTYGQIAYEESAWTGKKTLTVNGTVATKIAKNTYSLNGTEIRLKGGFFTKVTMFINNEAITLVESSKWYEWFLSMVSLIFVVIWGNSTTLCKIFPIPGSAIGYRLGGGYTYTLVLGCVAGAICGVAIVLSLIFMKKAKKPMNKILIGLGFDVAAILINALLAFLLITIY